MKAKLIVFMTMCSIVFGNLQCTNEAEPSIVQTGVTLQYPDWVQNLITELKNAPTGCSHGAIIEYQYKGKTVYYMPPFCCDFPSVLLSEDSCVICSPDGGFSGAGDGKCKDFFKVATKQKLIWQDDRRPESDNAVVDSVNVRITSLHPPIATGYNAVHFISDHYGIAVGNFGIAAKTIDGGNSWTQLNTATKLHLRSVYMVNSEIIYIAGGCYNTCYSNDSNIVLKTTDGGLSWRELPHPENASDFRSMYFTNKDTGVIVGYPGHIYTMDGGETWASVAHAGNQSVYFKDKSTGFFCGDGIFRTLDNGISVQKTSGPEDKNFIYQVDFPSLLTGYAAGGRYLYKSLTSGESWNITLDVNIGNIESVHFINDSVGAAFGIGAYTGGDFGMWYSAVHTTIDGGKTWKSNFYMPYHLKYLGSMCFPMSKKNIGFAVCDSIFRISMDVHYK